MVLCFNVGTLNNHLGSGYICDRCAVVCGHEVLHVGISGCRYSYHSCLDVRKQSNCGIVRGECLKMRKYV